MADRYWVGGTAAWDGTAGTKWALTSGGAGGQAIPTSADDVFFDAASGAVTCTISTGNTGAKSITCTGFTGTLAGTATLSVSGSITLSAGMTFTYTGVVSLLATGTITSAGKSFGGLTINGSGITVTLGDAATIAASGTTTLTQGTLTLNGFTLSTGIFSSSNTNTRSISFGSVNIALTSTTAGAVVLEMATVNNFTVTGTGGFTRNQVNSATVRFGPTGILANQLVNLTVNAGSSNFSITASSAFKNVNFTGSSCLVSASAVTILGNLTLATGGTYTSFSPTMGNAVNTITSNGKTLGNVTLSGQSLTLLDAMTSGGTFTFTAGIFNTQNFSVTSVSFSTAGTFTRTLNMGSSTWTITGNGWTVSTTTNLVINAGTSTISMTSASAKTFVGNGLTYYNINQGGAGALSINSSNTFSNITNTYSATGATSILFSNGTTNTFTNWSRAA
jgi:hypothetical protein